MHACAVLGMLVGPLGPLGVQATRDDLFSAPVLLMLETFAQDVPRGQYTAAASWMRKVSTSIGHVGGFRAAGARRTLALGAPRGREAGAAHIGTPRVAVGMRTQVSQRH